MEIATLVSSSWMPYAPQEVKGQDDDDDNDDDDVSSLYTLTHLPLFLF